MTSGALEAFLTLSLTLTLTFIKVASGELEDFARFVFHLSDFEDLGTLSEGNMLTFFGDVISLYAGIAVNVLMAEKSYLTEEIEVPEELIQGLIEDLEGMREEAESLVDETNDDGESMDVTERLSFYKWLNMRGTLPNLYTKLRHMCRGIVHREPADTITSFLRADEHRGVDEGALHRPSLMIQVPGRVEMAQLALSPRSPSSPYSLSPRAASSPYSDHREGIRGHSQEGPSSPIHDAFMSELRTQEAVFSPLSPQQKRILTDLDAVSECSMGITNDDAVPLSPIELKILEEIEVLQEKIQVEKILRSSPLVDAPVVWPREENSDESDESDSDAIATSSKSSFSSEEAAMDTDGSSVVAPSSSAGGDDLVYALDRFSQDGLHNYGQVSTRGTANVIAKMRKNFTFKRR